jgi:hypothetical protein
MENESQSNSFDFQQKHLNGIRELLVPIVTPQKGDKWLQIFNVVWGVLITISALLIHFDFTAWAIVFYGIACLVFGWVLLNLNSSLKEVKNFGKLNPSEEKRRYEKVQLLARFNKYALESIMRFLESSNTNFQTNYSNISSVFKLLIASFVLLTISFENIEIKLVGAVIMVGIAVIGFLTLVPRSNNLVSISLIKEAIEHKTFFEIKDMEL